MCKMRITNLAESLFLLSVMSLHGAQGQGIYTAIHCVLLGSVYLEVS